MAYTHLSRSERVVIANMTERGRSGREVATALGRSPSSISRELLRNRQGPGSYDPYLANWQAVERRRWGRPGDGAAGVSGGPGLGAPRLLAQAVEDAGMTMWMEGVSPGVEGVADP